MLCRFVKFVKPVLAIKKSVYITLLLIISSNVARTQHFEVLRPFDSKEIHCESFLYKQPAVVIKQAAHNVFSKYNPSSFYSEAREYFVFSGDSLNTVLMNNTDIVYWIESLGDEKSILYLTAFKRGTRTYVPALRYSSVIKQVKDDLNAVELESVNITNQMFLSEQYLRIHKLTDELQILCSDLQRLEFYTPNATTQINQIKMTIRIKKTTLNQENDILNQFKGSVGM